MQPVIHGLDTLAHAAVQLHVATPAAPLPPPHPPVAWIVAANGLFKRGVGANVDVLIRVTRTPFPIPHLCLLTPRVIFRGIGRRLPAVLLVEAYFAATLAVTVEHGELLLRERQFHVVLRDGQPVLCIPPQTATAHSVSYSMPTEPMLLDLHSHGLLPPFFSATDDADDQGLGVSAVIGSLSRTPAIVARLNVYGHHQRVRAADLFDGPLPFHDGGDRAPDRA